MAAGDVKHCDFCRQIRRCRDSNIPRISFTLAVWIIWGMLKRTDESDRSRFYFMLFVGMFVGGLLLCRSMFTPDTLVPNILRWYVRRKKLPKQEDELTLLKKICPVCGKENCSRHRPELNILALQPWTNLKIPEKVDVAVEEFLNIVLKEFVYTWYRDLGKDEAFVDELKTSLRFIISVLLRRLQKVDIPTLVLNRVLKTAVRHLHFYLQVKKKVKKDGDLELALLEYYGPQLHCALHNRRTEMEYLRDVIQQIFPYVLPLKYLQCRGLCSLLKEIVAGVIVLPVLDKLADPDTLNNLLLIFFDDSPPPVNHDPPSDQVTILANFAHPLCKNDSCLHLELGDILGNPEALFPFMQFMKTEASVNVLQFYLSVEELNSKILTPELSNKAKKDLHTELCDLYRMYCDPSAVDRIQFDEDILTQLQSICEGPVDGVIRLQTTTPLFRAYEHAYDLLENTFLPLFHQSDDYYKMVCGERLPTKLSRSSSSPTITPIKNTNNNRSLKRGGETMSFSKIGNKIKGVFKATAVEGKLPDDVDYGEETDPSMSMMDYDDILDGAGILGIRDNPIRDLSAWRVTIPEIGSAKQEVENPRKTFYPFIIDIRRVDVLEAATGRTRDDFEASNWQVARGYHEFYVLQSKLTEFHGEFEEAHLPPKKVIGTKSKDFLMERRPQFEQYLQSLLTIRDLRGSELLYRFLTPQCEFSSSFLPDINLGRMVKSGAMKLVKERGQHLEPFLQSVLQCTETVKPRPSREGSDCDTVSISSEKLSNVLYENNANTELDLSPTTPVLLRPGFEYPIMGIFDAIVYLAEHLYRAPKWLMTLLLTVRIMVKQSVDSFIDWYLGRKLDQVFQEHRIVILIHLLRDILFFDTDPPRTDIEKRGRRRETYKELTNYIPKAFAEAVGPQKFKEGTETVFELLQHPKLNKQLSYMLLDECLEELFPELLETVPDLEPETLLNARQKKRANAANSVSSQL